MHDTAPLFSSNQTRPYFDALDRHEKRYGATHQQRQAYDDAMREKMRAKDMRDARCQAFFEAMLRPPKRD